METFGCTLISALTVLV